MKKHLTLAITLALFVLLVVAPGCYVAYYQFDSPITATVLIKPESKQVQQTSTLQVVTGTPDAAKQQIAGARFVTSTVQQTATQQATGSQVTAAATAASGEVEVGVSVINGQHQTGTVTIFAGGSFTGKVSGHAGSYTIIADEQITVSVNSNGFFHAHDASPGASGNFDMNHPFDLLGPFTDSHGNTWNGYFNNSTAFTGGTDATTAPYIKQDDITSGKQTLEASTKQQALTALKAKATPSEQWIQGPACSAQDSTDGSPNQFVATFHVSTSATCNGELFDPQAIKDAATQLFVASTAKQYGITYHEQGTSSSTLNSIKLTDQQTGSLTVNLTSVGVWIFSPEKVQKQLALLIRGKSIVEAKNILQQQPGIVRVTITLQRSFWIWNALPTDGSKISFHDAY